MTKASPGDGEPDRPPLGDMGRLALFGRPPESDMGTFSFIWIASTRAYYAEAERCLSPARVSRALSAICRSVISSGAFNSAGVLIFT